MATEPEILQIAEEWQQQHAPKGLILTNTPDGIVNGSIINAHIMKNGGVVSIKTLSQAAEAEKFRLNWSPGFEPKVPAKVDRRSHFDQCVDAGFLPNRAEGSTHASRQAEAESATRAAEIERQRAAQAASQKAAEQRRLQYQEENVKIFFAGDRLNYGATEAAQKAAREKWAKINGKTLAPASLREIPTDRDLTRAEMSQYTKEEIARFLEKQKHLKRLAR
jgi:hypothetical protein